MGNERAGRDQNYLELYLDDSGSRFPDLKSNPKSSNGMDCFALGGILIERKNIGALLQAHRSLCESWNIDYPLHSRSIRMKQGKFAWLGVDSGTSRFFADLEEMIRALPIVAIACVIHRPGYNARYKKLYGEKRWMLSKTAYAILVERSAKLAQAKGLRLRVNFEGAGKREDRELLAYHRDLKTAGMPFSAETSGSYQPLSPGAFRAILAGEPSRQTKASAPCQIADLVLYPMAKAKYHPDYRPFQLLKSWGKLIDCVVGEERARTVGIKYSCFD